MVKLFSPEVGTEPNIHSFRIRSRIKFSIQFFFIFFRSRADSDTKVGR